MAGGLNVPNDREDEKWAIYCKKSLSFRESDSSSETIMSSKQIPGTTRCSSNGQETFKTGGGNLQY